MSLSIFPNSLSMEVPFNGGNTSKEKAVPVVEFIWSITCISKVFNQQSYYNELKNPTPKQKVLSLIKVRTT